jgi:hypothetical protein
MSQENTISAESGNPQSASASQGKLLPGATAGAIAAVIGAMLWAAVTVFSGYELGLIAIAVGYFVAFGVRSVGQGSTTAFAVTGATLAFLACVLGKVLTLIGLLAKEMEIGYFDVLSQFDLSLLPGLMVETASPMDLVFYGIAIYEGWRLSRVEG